MESESLSEGRSDRRAANQQCKRWRGLENGRGWSLNWPPIGSPVAFGRWRRGGRPALLRQSGHFGAVASATQLTNRHRQFEARFLAPRTVLEPLHFG